MNSTEITSQIRELITEIYKVDREAGAKALEDMEDIVGPTFDLQGNETLENIKLEKQKLEWLVIYKYLSYKPQETYSIIIFAPCIPFCNNKECNRSTFSTLKKGPALTWYSVLFDL